MNLKTPPPFPADLRADLLELYREDIRKLETLLNRDLSIWLDETEFTLTLQSDKNLHETIGK